MTAVGLQTAIWDNKKKTILLVVLFPILLLSAIFGFFYVMDMSPCTPHLAGDAQHIAPCLPTLDRAVRDSSFVFMILVPVIVVWAIISFAFHRSLIFAFTGATPIERKDYPKIYNVVENLCISRGLPTPHIGILEDDSYNAFAVGWDPKDAWIVFSRGMINQFPPEELEAVAAHELGHILNKDGLLMTAVVIFIGIIAVLGELLVRSTWFMSDDRSSDDDDSWFANIKLIFIALGIVMLILGYLVFPLVQLAISRRREYMADAMSADLTKRPEALINALERIHTDSVIESIRHDTFSGFCIADPFPEEWGLWTKIHNLWSTHPTIPSRIAMLQKYGG